MYSMLGRYAENCMHWVRSQKIGWINITFFQDQCDAVKTLYISHLCFHKLSYFPLIPLTHYSVLWGWRRPCQWTVHKTTNVSPKCYGRSNSLSGGGGWSGVGLHFGSTTDWIYWWIPKTIDISSVFFEPKWNPSKEGGGAKLNSNETSKMSRFLKIVQFTPPPPQAQGLNFHQFDDTDKHVTLSFQYRFGSSPPDFPGMWSNVTEVSDQNTHILFQLSNTASGTF